MEYRKMRRKDRLLPDAEAREILQNGEFGVLCTVGQEGLPYGVPLSYALEGEYIAFHCAKTGHKVDNLSHCPQVSFVVVTADKVKAKFFQNDYTSEYESVIVHGSARRVEDDGEKTHWLRLISEKYVPDHMDKFEMIMAASAEVTHVWKIHIDHLTGKARR